MKTEITLFDMFYVKVMPNNITMPILKVDKTNI